MASDRAPERKTPLLGVMDAGDAFRHAPSTVTSQMGDVTLLHDLDGCRTSYAWPNGIRTRSEVCEESALEREGERSR